MMTRLSFQVERQQQAGKGQGWWSWITGSKDGGGKDNGKAEDQGGGSGTIARQLQTFEQTLSDSEKDELYKVVWREKSGKSCTISRSNVFHHHLYYTSTFSIGHQSPKGCRVFFVQLSQEFQSPHREIQAGQFVGCDLRRGPAGDGGPWRRRSLAIVLVLIAQ